MGSNPIPIAHEAEVADAVAAHFAAAGRAALTRNGRFAVAVSPAALARPLVAALGAAPLARERFWRATHLFLADTCFAPRITPHALAARLPTPAGALHLEVAEHANPLTAAAAYEQELRGFFSLRAGALPRFDLAVLAFGADGRLGGLAPGGHALDEIERLALADFDPRTGRYFVTLTPPVIRNAARLLVVVPAGAADSVRRRIAGAEAVVERDPLRVLRAAEGELAVVAADDPEFGNTNPKGEAPCLPGSTSLS